MPQRINMSNTPLRRVSIDMSEAESGASSLESNISCDSSTSNKSNTPNGQRNDACAVRNEGSKAVCKPDFERNAVKQGDMTTQTDSLGSHHRSTLSMSDLPTTSNRPKCGDSYLKYMESRKNPYQYDQAKRCFKNTVEVPKRETDVWTTIQLKSMTIEPLIEYGKLGFQFRDDNIPEKLGALLNECDQLTDHQRDYMGVKIESIKALYLLCTCHQPEAGRLLHDLERKVVSMENCDLTAWFHVASFVARLQDMHGMWRYTGAIRNYHKTQCLSHLQKARTCFSVWDSTYTTLATLALWWMGLVHADVTKQFMEPVATDTSTKVKHPCLVLTDLEDKEKNHANDCLRQFLTKIKHLKEFNKCEDQRKYVCRLLDVLKSNGITNGAAHGEDIREADVVILRRLYSEFMKRIKGKKRPRGIIHQITMNTKEGKILVVTSNAESPELHKFLRENEAEMAYFTFRHGAPSELLMPPTKDEYDIVVRNKITNGSPLIGFPNSYCRANKIPEELKELCKLGKLEWSTLGCFVTDRNDPNRANKKGLGCGHSWQDHANRNGHDVIRNVSFYSVHQTEEKQEVSNISVGDCIGLYNPYKLQSGDEVLIDALLFDLDDEFHNEPHVEMLFKTPKDKPMPLKIFTGDLEELKNVTVSMVGARSGRCLGQGTIVVPNVFGVELEGIVDLVNGLIAVDLNHKQMRSLLAKKGDSGAVLFGFVEGILYAIALVCGRNPEYVYDEDGVYFPYTTLATPLKHIHEYFLREHGKDLEVYCEEAVAIANACQAPSTTKQVEKKFPIHGDSGYSTTESHSLREGSDCDRQIRNETPLTAAALREHDRSTNKDGNSPIDSFLSHIGKDEAKTERNTLACAQFRDDDKIVPKNRMIGHSGATYAIPDKPSMSTSKGSFASTASSGGYASDNETVTPKDIERIKQQGLEALEAVKAINNRVSLDLRDIPNTVQRRAGRGATVSGSPVSGGSPYDSETCVSFDGVNSSSNASEVDF